MFLGCENRHNIQLLILLVPPTFKMYGASSFVSILNLIPLIKHLFSAQSADLDFCFPDQFIIFQNCLVINLECYSAINLYDFLFEEFIGPLRCFALIICYLGLNFLLACFANYIWVHLTEKNRVSFKVSFNDLYYECSSLHYN